jgi:hypothetical protein
MLYQLKRHPLAIRAFFGHCLVLTYAFPEELLTPLLPPGLILDTFGELGFLAVAMVQTRGLRPVFLPAAMGVDFFLAGYRIFTRFQSSSGRNLRGLRILRSDTDRQLMASAGNLLTHYGYHKAAVRCVEKDGSLSVSLRTPAAEADLEVIADLSSKPAPLPERSPFATLQEARKFAGPLPFTFDYEAQTHSMLVIQGVRQRWDPQPIRVQVVKNTFLTREPFRNAGPVLASAFHLADVPYLWRRGVREPVPGGSR